MLPQPTMSSSEATAPWSTTDCHAVSSTSMDNASTQQPSSSSDQSQEIADDIWIYMGPIIFFVGLIGNVLILIVMSSRRMRGTSTSGYLIIMAVADLLTIVTAMIPEWLEAMDIFSFQECHPVSCKLYKFLSYSFGDMATWIRVLFTLDRFMAICFPMKKTDCCLPQRAKFYCLGAALAAFAKNMHVFWTRGAEYETTPVHEYVDCVLVKTNDTVTVLKSNCGYPKPEYRYFEQYVRPWIVFVLVNLIPFLVILICNVFIIRAMIQMKRRQLHLTTMKGSGERHLLQTTAMCLGASFAFLVCVTPTMVLLIGKPYWTAGGTNMAYDVVKSVSNQLLYVNNSVNFFLYCITGQKFRETLVMILCCRCTQAQKRQDNSSGHHSTTVRRPVLPLRGSREGPTSNGIGNDATTAMPSNRNSSPDVTSRMTSPMTRHDGGAGDAVPDVVNEVVVEREKELEDERNDGNSPEDVENGGLRLTVLGEKKNKSERFLKVRSRTESDSSSGISSSTSKDTQPEANEDLPPDLIPALVGESLNQSVDKKTRSTRDSRDSPEHSPTFENPASEKQLEVSSGETKDPENPQNNELLSSDCSTNSAPIDLIESLDLRISEPIELQNNEKLSSKTKRLDNNLYTCRKLSLDGEELVLKPNDNLFFCEIDLQSETSHVEDNSGRPLEPSCDQIDLEILSNCSESTSQSSFQGHANLGTFADVCKPEIMEQSSSDSDQRIFISASKEELKPDFNESVPLDIPYHSNC